MVGGDFRADVQQAVFVHPELDQHLLGLDFGLAEVATLRLGNILVLATPAPSWTAV
jgi:hypothetical protein